MNAIPFGSIWLLALCLSSLFIGNANAQAPSFPSKPITFIVPNPPGGPTDTLVRTIAAKMSENLRQTIVIDNKSGAGGIIAAQFVSRAPPDGYTLGCVYLSHATNLHVRRDLPYNTLNAFRPVTLLAKGSLVLLVSSKVPAKSVAELIGYAKANPSKLNYAASGLGGASHLGGELFKALAGIDMQVVPYKGAATLIPDLITGRIDLTISGYQQYVEHIKSGAVRALGVSAAERFDAAPDLPAISNTVPGYDVSAWYGVLVPAGTPTEIVERLHREFARALADASVKLRIQSLGLAPGSMTPAAFGGFIQAEINKWGPIVVNAGLVEK